MIRARQWGPVTVGLAGLVGLILVFGRMSTEPDPDTTFKAALSNFRQGNKVDLREPLRVLMQDPEYTDHATLLIGISLLSQQRLDEALEQFSRIPPSSPLRLEVLRYAGETLYHLGLLQPSEQTFRMLAVEEPGNVDAQRWLGAIYFDLGAYEPAIIHLQKVVDLNSSDFQAPRAIAGMLKDFERYEEAIPYYEMALQRGIAGQRRQATLKELLESLIAAHRYKQALSLLKESTSDDDHPILAATCHFNLGDTPAAVRLLDCAAKQNAWTSAGDLLQAEILCAESRYDEAANRLRQLLEREPHHVKARYQYAIALRRLGYEQQAEAELARWNESLNLMKRLNELNTDATGAPYDAALRIELAEVCRELGKDQLAVMWEQAAAACRQVAESDPVGTAPAGE